MAYLTKDSRERSPYWIGVYCVAGPDGGKRWLKKSTKTTNKNEAKEMLEGWQKAADGALRGALHEARIREVVNETIERVTGKKLDMPTVQEWFERWLRTERDAVSEATMTRYRQVTRDFLSCIGKQANAPLETLSTDHVLRFRDERLASGRSPQTVNLTIKILRRPFKIALDQGFIDRNPAAAVRRVRGKGAKKSIFTADQVEKLLAEASGDWKGLILTAYFAGGRLGDLARLKWSNVDLAQQVITFAQRKTDGEVKIPIHPDLQEHLLSLPSSDKPTKPVFPQLFDKRGAGKSGLSASFKRLMERAGIDDGIARKKSGKLGRNVSALSFHSFRHSFNSAMANANVPIEIRQKLTGHASTEMNKNYTHHEMQVIRDAVNLVPGLRKGAA